MDRLPQTPAILVSAVNMLLRDGEFDSLEALCYNYDTTADELQTYLLRNGYRFDEDQQQFKAW